MPQQIVTLNPGESKVVAFEFTPAVARSYGVVVDGLSGSFVAITQPIVTDKIGIVLKNPPASATHWQYYLQTVYGTDWSPLTGIAEVAYVKPTYWWIGIGDLAYVVLWHMVGTEWVSDGVWRGTLYISEYGLYEFDWQAHSLIRIS